MYYVLCNVCMDTCIFVYTPSCVVTCEDTRWMSLKRLATMWPFWLKPVPKNLFSPTQRGEKRGNLMGERGVGRPAWLLSSSTRPPSKPLASSSERSAWGSRAATPRGISSEEMRSRASGTDRGREVSRSRKRRRRSQRSSSPKHSKRERATPILGKTSGMAAVGAWAARYEIANLLTSKCDPNELVRVIHKGEEGRDEILYRGYLLSPSPDRSRRGESEKERSHGGSQASGKESRKGPLLESDDGEKSQTSVADILKVPEAAKPETPDEPPWVKRISEKTKGLLGHHQGDASELGLRFAKPAVPPRKSRPETAKETLSEEPPKTAGVAEGERFAKAAKPPKATQDVRTPGALTVKTVGGTMPRTVKDREARDLAVYQEKSLKIFGTLRLMGIEMDLSDLVLSSDGKVNEDRFSLHTAPNRASTGLRYARLMENLLKWGHEDERPVREGSTPFDRLCTLEFVEHLMQRGCGANTRKRSFSPWTTTGRRLDSNHKRATLAEQRDCPWSVRRIRFEEGWEPHSSGTNSSMLWNAWWWIPSYILLNALRRESFVFVFSHQPGTMTSWIHRWTNVSGWEKRGSCRSSG